MLSNEKFAKQNAMKRSGKKWSIEYAMNNLCAS